MIELEIYIVKANPSSERKIKTKRVPVLDSFSFSLERKFQPIRTTETEPTRVPVLDSFSFSFSFRYCQGRCFDENENEYTFRSPFRLDET